jgi:hypothetical protein
MCGLMRRLAISLQRMGFALKEKIGNRTGKIKTNWFTLEEKIIIFIAAMLNRRKLYLPDNNVPANEFLNLEGNKLST